MNRTLHAIYGWLLLLPAIVLLAAFTHYPAIATVWHSFFSTPRGKRSAAFVGAENYRLMVDDPVFWTILLPPGTPRRLRAISSIPLRSWAWCW